MTEARSRLQSFLDTAEACRGPPQTTHLLAADSPEHMFFDTGILGKDDEQLSVRYRDSNLGVVARPEFPDDRIWVFGTDPFHETGVVGLPFSIPKDERPFVWTREKVLDLLSLDGWQPVVDETDPLVPYYTSQRLQGRAAVHRVPQSYAKKGCLNNDSEDILAPDGGPLVAHKGSSKKLAIGDQTVTVESAGILNAPALNIQEHFGDEEANVLLFIPEGALLSITGPHHERRQLEVAGGAYEFHWLGTTMQSFVETHDQRSANP